MTLTWTLLMKKMMFKKIYCYIVILNMSLTQFQDFLYKNKSVTTYIINEEIWFKAKDVCDILGYNNHNKTIKDLVKNSKFKSNLSDLKGGNKTVPPLDTAKNEQGQTVVINEAGLYCLVFRSHKEAAQQFTEWVAEHVIPSIRKTGRFEDQERIKQLEMENKRLDKTIDWYMDHDVTKTTDSFHQKLPVKKMEYISAKKQMQLALAPILQNPFDFVYVE